MTTLEKHAYNIRRYALRMGEVQGQGYIGQALGMADILAVAYCHALKFKASDPGWEGRDRFLLSHGHYAIAHYAALIEAGIIAEAELETYGCDDSRLPMSGMATYTPGMEISGGSLGQGLTVAGSTGVSCRNPQNDCHVANAADFIFSASASRSWAVSRWALRLSSCNISVTSSARSRSWSAIRSAFLSSCVNRLD